jgi:hypothetical protein
MKRICIRKCGGSVRGCGGSVRGWMGGSVRGYGGSVKGWEGWLSKRMDGVAQLGDMVAQ